jgi:hypothetical protein
MVGRAGRGSCSIAAFHLRSSLAEKSTKRIFDDIDRSLFNHLVGAADADD